MKIKQLVCFTLAILIFGTKVSFALNVHYCGNHIAEVSLAFISANCEMEPHQDSKIPFKTEVSKKSCCKDNTVLFQNQQHQKVNLEAVQKATAINTSILLPVYSLDSKLILISKVFPKWNAPPTKSDKLFLTQQSFIFYG